MDCSLLADDFDQHALAAQAVEFAVKTLLPRTEVEATAGHRDDHLVAHDAALEVCVGVVLLMPLARRKQPSRSDV